MEGGVHSDLMYKLGIYAGDGVGVESALSAVRLSTCGGMLAC
jgi:hypothetical protein